MEWVAAGALVAFAVVLAYCSVLQGAIWSLTRGLNTRAETSQIHVAVALENQKRFERRYSAAPEQRAG